MKKIFLFIALTFLAFFSARAQTATATETVQSADNHPFKPLAKALLWKISGNGLDAPSYLFGTIHLIDKDSFFLDKETQAAIDDSREIVFEIDLEKEMNPLTMLALAPKMMMQDKTLKDLLSEADYQLVVDKFKETGMPMFLADKMKPMFVSMLLENPQDSVGATEMVSYEMKIMDIAKAKNKPISGLETAMYQMSMFDSIPLTQQADMLVQALRDTTGLESVDGMATMYKSRDINAMAEMIGEMSEGDFTEFLLVGRNRNWIPVMEKKMKEGPRFFAVGAGHLGASYGVINLLRKAGYTVQPVAIAPQK